MSQEQFNRFVHFVEEQSQVQVIRKPDAISLQMLARVRDSMKTILDRLPKLSTEILVVSEMWELMQLISGMWSNGMMSWAEEWRITDTVNRNVISLQERVLSKSMVGTWIEEKEHPILAVTIWALGQAYSWKIRQVLVQWGKEESADFMFHGIQNDYMKLMGGRWESKLPESYFRQRHQFPTYPQ